MMSMESYRKSCLKQQTELRRMLTGSSQHEKAIQLFLNQHAMLHSKRMSGTEAWSFEDEILDDMPEVQIRRIPGGRQHSIAWLIWHIARCEDITLNLLVAGTPQVLHKDGWLKKMKISALDTGNTMDPASLLEFSEVVDIEAMRNYRAAVGRATREIVSQLQPGDLKRKMEPARLEKIWDEGAVLPAAAGIVEYWSKRDVAGLLLMPATRHPLTHLNEALDLKRLHA